MILNVVEAKYIEDYKVVLKFDDGVKKLVDLKETIFGDRRAIFQPLRQQDFFKNFRLEFNTITWQNEADFAPEYLYEIGSSIQS